MTGMKVDNTYWPAAMESLGVRIRSSYDIMSSNSTTVVLLNGKGIIVRFGGVDKCDPERLVLCMMCHAGNKLARVRMKDGSWQMNTRDPSCLTYWSVCISPDKRIIVERITESRDVEQVGEVDTDWLKEKMNELPELMDDFSY